MKKIWILLMISEMNILTSLSLSVKLPVAKPENVFAFGGEVKDEAFVIEKTHCGSNQKFCSLFSYTNKAWMELITNCSVLGEGVGSLNTGNTLQGTDYTVDQETARMEVESQVVNFKK